jgi:DNA (cytosine-5)-methyltransferase 1
VCAKTKEKGNMNELHLFSGAGGGILGGLLLGHTTVCAVEIEPYCRKVLLQRQRDGILPWFPIWDDVRTFDGRPWRGIADVVCGGFPCQDVSAGSSTKNGLDGERSGLWEEQKRVVCEVEPKIVYVENSAMLTSRGLGRVLWDLAAMGYNAEWGVLRATDTGFPHERERIWIVAYSDKIMGQERARVVEQYREPAHEFRIDSTCLADSQNLWVEMASKFYRMDDGMANRLERTECLGNGQVPAVAAKAWHVLCQRAAAEHYGTGQNIGQQLKERQAQSSPASVLRRQSCSIC